MRSKLLVHCLEFTLFILIKQLYTALTVACMPKYILLRKIGTLLDLADEPRSKMLGEWSGWWVILQ